MTDLSSNTSSFSSICIEHCKGRCCDPWWGIIAYQVRKDGGLTRLNNFREEILRGIRDRERRIIERYVTTEAPPRPLFKSPERYSIIAENIKTSGSTIFINLRAMFAFRCLFLSEDKVCTIHPSVIGGSNIRPEHCGYLGSLEAKPNEKGYCRIIHTAAASNNDISKIMPAIDMENSISQRYYNEGYTSAEGAAEALIENIKVYVEKNAPGLIPDVPKETTKSPGRNDPCYCGSGKKFKKCHGL